jgi:hypothetical protein
MKISRKFLLPLAALLFAFALAPQAAMAGAADCPTEPKQGVAIASGTVYAGSNCTLNSTGDLDSFVFSAKSGDIWHFLVSGNNESDNGIDVCLSLRDPSGTQIYSHCADTAFNVQAFGFETDQTLTATGIYTIGVSELTNGTLNYGLSLERDYPTPTDAQGIQLTQTVIGTLGPGEDSPAYTFPIDTTGTYQVAATIPGGVDNQANLCMTVFLPNGTAAGSGCTDTAFNVQDFTIKIDLAPTANGTSMVLVYPDLNVSGGTVNYSLEVSCLSGICKQPTPPACTLLDTPSYSAGTLTMNFTVGNLAAATWNVWLTDLNTTTSLYSAAQPSTNPPVPITKTATVSKAGEVGVLSTLTTPTKGILCSNFVKVATGTP